jgi:hypothetical protein
MGEPVRGLGGVLAWGWDGMQRGVQTRVRLYSPTGGIVLHFGLLELLQIAMITDALAARCDTPHEPSVNGLRRPTFFLPCLQTTKNPDGPVNTPQRPTSRRSSCYQEWSSVFTRETNSHLVARLELDVHGYSCPRGL